MPSIKEALNASRAGLKPIEASEVRKVLPVPQHELDELVAHPLMRCPLPTPSVSSDVLQPFRIGTTVPKRRMIAPDTGLGNSVNVTSTTTTTVISSGSSSSSSSSLSSTVAENASYVTNLLANGQQEFGTITLSKMFAVLNCSVTSPARVQLYSTSAAQLADSGRGQVPPTGTTQHGVIMDLYLDTADKFFWVMSPIADGANQDDPQSDFAYITVTNLSAAAVITVAITFVPEEP